jgi:predicted transcriptional regulator
MGNGNDGLASSTIRNIEQALASKDITRNALAAKSGIPKSTLYRNLDHPDKFTLRELGQIATALEVTLVELVKDAA